MKTEDQIRALAELGGYKIDGLNVVAPDGCAFSLSGNEVLMAGLSDYLASYDAILPVIQKQHPAVQRHVIYDLQAELHNHWKQTGIDTAKFSETEWMIACMTATPSQLCEALLRATGKWVE